MKRYVVRAKDYNGHKDVLFMMDEGDFRFGTDNYETVSGPGLVFQKEGLFVSGGVSYKFHADWSLTPKGK